MMNFILKLSLVIILFSGCNGDFFDTVVEVDLPEEPSKLVLNGVFHTDSIMMIEASNSKWIMDTSKIISVTDANIKVTDLSGNVFELFHAGSGNYKSLTGINPQVGMGYTISAESKEFGICTADLKIPEKGVIRSFIVRDSIKQDQYGEMIDELEITLQDLPEENYYIINLVMSSLDHRFNLPFYNTMEVDMDLQPSQVDRKIISNDDFQKGDHTFHIYFYRARSFFPGEPVPEYFLSITSINKEYFFYLKGVENQQTSQGNPFAEPVPVYSNNSTGMGIIGGATNIQVAIP